MLLKGTLCSPYWFEGSSGLPTYIFLTRLVQPVPAVANHLRRATSFRRTQWSAFMSSFTPHSILTTRQLCVLVSPSRPLREFHNSRKAPKKYKNDANARVSLDPIPHAENVAPGLYYCPMPGELWCHESLAYHSSSSSTSSPHLPSCKQDKSPLHLQPLKRNQCQPGDNVCSQTPSEAVHDKEDSQTFQPLGSHVDKFYVSPVCEAMGGLWQWRAVWRARDPYTKPTAPPYDHYAHPSTYKEELTGERRMNWDCAGHNVCDALRDEQTERDPTRDMSKKGKRKNGSLQHPTDLQWGAGEFHMLPFLLFPFVGRDLGSGPFVYLNPAVAAYLLPEARSLDSQRGCWGGFPPGRESDAVEIRKTLCVTIPSLIGNVVIKLGEHAPLLNTGQTHFQSHRHVSSLCNGNNSDKVLHQVLFSKSQRAVENIFNLLIPEGARLNESDVSPLPKVPHGSLGDSQTSPVNNPSQLPPSQASSPRHSSDHAIQHVATAVSVKKDSAELMQLLGGSYSHVFSTPSAPDKAFFLQLQRQNEAREREGPSPLVSAISSTPVAASASLPLGYRNIISGGLAELILAIDCYAALIARKELTVASACWAILCDTKHSDVLLGLRYHALEIEREVLAAVEAQKHLARIARQRNQTYVGKSSDTVTTLMEYPAMAHWRLS